MGARLIEYCPIFRSTLEECNRHLAELRDRPCWSIMEELTRPEEESYLQKAEFSQPLCTALQLGLIDLLDSWELKPIAVVGHSSGEIAAAYAAGYLSLRDAIVTAYIRGLVLRTSYNASLEEQCAGSMCAVGLSEDETRNLLARYCGRVQLAAVNSPASCTISGDTDAIQEVESLCASKGHFCRRLHTDRGN